MKWEGRILLTTAEQLIVDWDINVDTISINTEDDLEFARCEYTGAKTMVQEIGFLTNKGEDVSMNIDADLAYELAGIGGYY